MLDISKALKEIMQEKKCTSIYAFYLLGGQHDKSDEPVPLHNKPIRPKTQLSYKLGKRN